MTTDELQRLVELGKLATARPWSECISNLAIGIYRGAADGAFLLSGPEATWGQRAADIQYATASANSADKLAATLLAIGEYRQGILNTIAKLQRPWSSAGHPESYQYTMVREDRIRTLEGVARELMRLLGRE